MNFYDGYGNVIEVESEVPDTPAVATKEYDFFSNSPCLYPYKNARTVKLEAESATAVISGVTVADMEHMGAVSYSNIEPVESEVGYKYRITTLGENNNAYRISGKVAKLVVGDTYRICIKHQKFDDVHRYMQVMVNSNSLTTKSSGNYNDLYGVHTGTFVATKETCDIYIWPFHQNQGTVGAVGDEAVIYDVYVNRVFDGNDYLTHEKYHHEEVSVSESAEFTGFDKMIIEADNTCGVYIEPFPSKVQTVNGFSPDQGGNVAVPKSHLAGKTLVCFGDSITQKCETEGKSYSDIIAANTGLNVINAGFGGTRMSERNGYENWDAVAFYSFADAIATGDWTAAEAGAASGSEGMDAFPAKVARLKALDWNTVDYITLAYGANDITTDANDSIIDSEDDLYNVHTFLGAFRHSYEAIIAVYPHIRFLILTPIYRYFKENGVFNQDSDDKMFAGETQHYYAWGDALVELCKEYKLPYIDLYRTLGINKFNRDYYFADETGRADGVHPNANGCKIMGDAISGGLLAHY